MTKTIGTAHFASRGDAVDYYAKQDTCAEVVDEMIEEGNIHIGKPGPIGPGWVVELRESDGRYIDIYDFSEGEQVE